MRGIAGKWSWGSWHIRFAGCGTTSSLPARETRMLVQRRLFLDVARSVTGRAWRDRLDERTSAGALSIAQRHGVPELLARIVAGRGIELEGFEAYLDPTVKRLMPDPEVLTDMAGAAERLADAI